MAGDEILAEAYAPFVGAHERRSCQKLEFASPRRYELLLYRPLPVARA